MKCIQDMASSSEYSLKIFDESFALLLSSPSEDFKRLLNEKVKWKPNSRFMATMTASFEHLPSVMDFRYTLYYLKRYIHSYHLLQVHNPTYITANPMLTFALNGISAFSIFDIPRLLLEQLDIAATTKQFEETIRRDFHFYGRNHFFNIHEVIIPPIQEKDIRKCTTTLYNFKPHAMALMRHANHETMIRGESNPFPITICYEIFSSFLTDKYFPLIDPHNSTAICALRSPISELLGVTSFGTNQLLEMLYRLVEPIDANPNPQDAVPNPNFPLKTYIECTSFEEQIIRKQLDITNQQIANTTEEPENVEVEVDVHLEDVATAALDDLDSDFDLNSLTSASQLNLERQKKRKNE